MLYVQHIRVYKVLWTKNICGYKNILLDILKIFSFYAWIPLRISGSNPLKQDDTMRYEIYQVRNQSW